MVIRDRSLGDEFQRALRQVLTLVMEGKQSMRVTIDTVLALKGLKRIGDHPKNTAEQVLFLIGGETATRH